MTKVSFLILAKNEEKFIGRCLDSIFSLDRDRDTTKLEVIVVNNDSSDWTRSIAIDMGAQVVDSSSKNIGDLRNVAAQNASGDFLAYIDADCTVPRSWLVSALNHFSLQSKAAAVGGYLNLPDDAGWLEKAWALPSEKQIKKNVNLVGASMMVKKSCFFDIGGFNGSLKTGEDGDISQRLLRAGYVTISDASCNVTHFGYPDSAVGFIDRQIWQVLGQFKFANILKDKSIFFSILFCLSLIFCFLSAFFSYRISLSFFLVALSVLFAFSLTKIYRSDLRFRLFTFFQISWVCALYFCGRFIGVIFYFFNRNYSRKYKK
jgi:glycosyltransferase involved in cell wall biosynthesis